MIYLLAMSTGLRASELASLAPGSFDLESAVVVVQAGYTKNGKQAVQPLPADVVRSLADYLESKAGQLWPGKWHKQAAEMLRGELNQCGIAYRDEAGHVADFHALRHSYISVLAQSGVHPKIAQELARHSDIRLTMNVYTHARLVDLAGAVESMPSLLSSPAGPVDVVEASKVG